MSEIDSENVIEKDSKNIIEGTEKLNLQNQSKDLNSAASKIDLELDKELIERVKNITANQLGVEINSIELQSSFVSDLKADSLDLVELVMSFEEEFDCEIPDGEAEKIQTIEAAVESIKRLKK